MFSFHRLARIEVTAGLQISQPCPWPHSASTASKVFSCLTLMTANSSVRDSEKCSHTRLTTALPSRLSSACNKSVANGKQPPQPVPARVQCLIAPTESRFCSRIAATICCFVTLLHEQIWASPDIESAPAAAGPPGLPTKRSCGGHSSTEPLLARIE